MRPTKDIEPILQEVAATCAVGECFVGLLLNDEPPLSEYANHALAAARWAGTIGSHRDIASMRKGFLETAALAVAAVQEIDRRAAMSQAARHWRRPAPMVGDQGIDHGRCENNL